MKKTFLFLVLISPLLARANEGSSFDMTFKKANRAYLNENFQEAIILYEETSKSGIQDWAVHYNLGNAYYNTGQTGSAIASYLRAFRLNPRNDDLIFNLTLTLKKCGETFIPIGVFPRWLWNVYHFLSLGELALSISILYTLLLILLSIKFIFKKEIPFHINATVIFILITISSIFILRLTDEYIKTSGVVTTPQLEVKSGPAESYTASFILPEGRRVIILKDEANWYEIGVPKEGLKGWVNKNTIEII